MPNNEPTNRRQRREQQYGRVSDLQRLLQLSPSSAYALIAQGEIAAVRVGRALRVDMLDVQRYIDENRVGGTLADVDVETA